MTKVNLFGCSVCPTDVKAAGVTVPGGGGGRFRGLPKSLQVSRLKVASAGKKRGISASFELQKSLLETYLKIYHSVGGVTSRQLTANDKSDRLRDGRMLFVTYTMGGDVIRIISARGAEPHEKRKYREL